MAHKDTIENTDPSVNAMDYAAHEGTYNRVMGMTKWAVIGLAVLVVILYLVIKP